MLFILFFKRFYLFIFKTEGKRGRKKHQCVVASDTSPTGDLACNPGMCPDWELKWRPFGSQADTWSTEPHQPGHKICTVDKDPRLLAMLSKFGN